MRMLIRHALGVRRVFGERIEKPLLPKSLRKSKLAWDARSDSG